MPSTTVTERRQASVVAAMTASLMLLTTCVATDRAVRPAPRRDGFVTSEGGELRLDGRRYRFLGVNVYSLASFPSEDEGFVCGPAHTDEQVRATLSEVAAMGGNAVRIDVYQSFTMGGEDYSRIDLILDEAIARGIRVIMTLENQWADCTEGGYKYADWYRNGYSQPYGDYPLSYREHVRRIVTRYRDHPGVLMWQLMNEAESRTLHGLDDPEALMGFTADMAGLVRAIDRRHVLSLGTSGVARVGSGGAFYALLHQVPGIDVVEAHDYHADAQPMPREIWLSLLASRAVGLPFFIGEVGMDSPPLTPETRARLISEKLEAAWSADVSGVLIWSYRSGDGGNKDFHPDDPLVNALRRFSRTRHVRPAPE